MDAECRVAVVAPGHRILADALVGELHGAVVIRPEERESDHQWPAHAAQARRRIPDLDLSHERVVQTVTAAEPVVLEVGGEGVSGWRELRADGADVSKIRVERD